MKKKFITLRGLKKVLSNRELKNVLGGSYTGPYVCIWYNNFEGNGSFGCTNSPNQAEQKAGGNYWACNNQEALEKCCGSVPVC